MRVVTRLPYPRLQGYQRMPFAEGGLSLRDTLFFYVGTRCALFALVTVSFIWPRVNTQPIPTIRTGALSPIVLSSPVWLRPFAQWDGVHYLEIAASGYSWPLAPVFFPLYPLLVRLLVFDHASWLIAAGMAVSLVATGVAVLLLARLIEIDHPDAAWPAIVLLLLYPGALFLSVTYSEGLELLLFVGAAYAARRRWWWPAGGLGALAALTRPPGIVIIALLAVEYLGAESRRRIHLLAVALPIAGTAVFAAYLALTLHDPLAFVHHQQAFQRSVGILPIEITSGHFFTSPSVWVWAAAFAVSLWAIRALRPSYGAFAAALLLTAPLTGAFGSSIRYVAIAWPVFAVAGLYLRNDRQLLVVGSILALGLAFLTLLFTHGYYVA